MHYLLYETPKSGLPDDQNEDSSLIRKLSKNELLVNISDGASTGVFSRLWSDHLTHGIDSRWFTSLKDFEFGIAQLRESFKPEIKRPTALRKFLLEGSYATLLSVIIKKVGWLFSSIEVQAYGSGDVNLIIVDDEGKFKFSFPYAKFEEFDNVPALIRSSDKLQQKTPVEFKAAKFEAKTDDLVIIASDAIAEFLFSDKSQVLERVSQITQCKDNQEFRKLCDDYRKNHKMKNDDASIFFYSDKPHKFFTSRGE